MASRPLARRLVEMAALAACLGASFYAGTRYAGPAPTAAGSNWPFGDTGAAPATVFPPNELPASEPPPGDGARAKQLREALIRRDAESIRAECQSSAGGDWDRWQRDTEPYRAALRSRLDQSKPVERPGESFPEDRYQALESVDGFPLFEVGAREHLKYLYDPESLAGFRRDRPVVAANRWLARQGIDLIFASAPKMLEVYCEHFLDPHPTDGVIAPHARRALLEILDAGVETVDGLAVFRPQREPAPDYLCNAYEAHWAPRGMRVMAKEVADRVARYPFGARARYAIPQFVSIPGGYPAERYSDGLDSMAGWAALTPEQQARARAAQTTNQARLRTRNGGPVLDDPKSPVLLMGNSYVEHFREQLVRELNMRVRTKWGGALSTEPFTDFLRDPGELRGVRVVLWVTTEEQMTQFKPLPAAVAAALAEDAGAR